MPPRKKKVVEEEKPVEVSHETDTTDVLLERVDEVPNVIENSKEEAAKISETVTEEAVKISETVETVKEEATNVATTVAETVKEDINKVAEVVSKTFSELFLDVVKSGNLNKDIKIVLTKEATDILIKIIGVKPTFLDDVEKALLEVVKDGKIDSSDLPNLILLIQKLYEMVYAVKDIKLDVSKRSAICAELLKFISHYLIVERRIEIANDIQSQFLEQIDKLIDSCVGLLSFSKTIKVKGCFSSLFGKK